MWHVCVGGGAVDSETVFPAGPMFWLLAIYKVLILTSLSDNVRTPSLRKKTMSGSFHRNGSGHE